MMTTRKEKKKLYIKLYKSKEGKTIKFYTFCVKLSGSEKKRRKGNIKKYQGGLTSARNAFLLKVFNSMGYLG